MASGRGLIELLNLMRRQAEAGKAVSKIAPVSEQAKHIPKEELDELRTQKLQAEILKHNR